MVDNGAPVDQAVLQECWERFLHAVSISHHSNYMHRLSAWERERDARRAEEALASLEGKYRCECCGKPVPAQYALKRLRLGKTIKYCSRDCFRQAYNCIRTGRPVQPKRQLSGKCICGHFQDDHLGGEVCVVGSCDCPNFHLPWERDRNNDVILPQYQRFRFSLDQPLPGTDDMVVSEFVAALDTSDPAVLFERESIEPEVAKRVILHRYASRTGALYKSTKAERNVEIFERWRSGDAVADLAKDYGVSSARIHMIVAAVESHLIHDGFKLGLQPRDLGIAV